MAKHKQLAPGVWQSVADGPGAWQSVADGRLLVDPEVYDEIGAALESILARAQGAEWRVLRAPTSALVEARLEPEEEHLSREEAGEDVFSAGQYQVRVHVAAEGDPVDMLIATEPLLTSIENIGGVADETTRRVAQAIGYRILGVDWRV